MVIDTDDPNPEPLDNETSYPVGAVTVIFEVKLDPETVKLLEAEGVPVHVDIKFNEETEIVTVGTPT